MQLHFPYYPKDSKMISDRIGVYEKGDLVQYIVNGLPVYSHDKADLNAFRFITSNFIYQGLCRKVDVQRCFGVSEDTVGRAVKKYKEKGEAGFFGDDARFGRAHKIVGECRIRIQNKLDKQQSVNSIAKEEGVRESAIRYQIKVGHLKKSLPHR
jgi:transposase